MNAPPNGPRKGARVFGIRWILIALFACGILACPFLWRAGAAYRQRSAALEALRGLEQGIRAGDVETWLVIPVNLQKQTAAEREQYLKSILKDESSPEGAEKLRRKGRFGSLLDLFPEEGPAWAGRAGVDPKDCLAWRMDQSGFRSEAVFVKTPAGLKIVRVNNVKQLAMERNQ